MKRAKNGDQRRELPIFHEPKKRPLTSILRLLSPHFVKHFFGGGNCPPNHAVIITAFVPVSSEKSFVYTVSTRRMRAIVSTMSLV